MTTNIKGKLVDGFGKPIAKAQMRALATQTSVPIAGATAYVKTDANGDYDFPLEIGNYAFSIWFGDLGYQYVGNIEIIQGTPDASLDQILVLPPSAQPMSLTKILQALVDAEAAAEAASSAAGNAAEDAANQVRDSLIPLGQQYNTLAEAQAAVTAGTIKNGAYCYVRSSSVKDVADEYVNNGGTLVATGKSMPSSSFVKQVANQASQTDARTEGVQRGKSVPFEIVSKDGRQALAIDSRGQTLVNGGLKLNGVPIKSLPPNSEYLLAFTDSHNKVAFAIGKNAFVEILGMRFTITSGSNLIEIIDKFRYVAGGVRKNGVLFNNSSDAPEPDSPDYTFIDFAERMHVLIYGQSLSLGAYGTPILGTNAKDAIMYNTGVRSNGVTPTSLVQLTERVNGTYGESIASGMSHDFTDKSGGMYGRKLIMNAAGVGGIQIEGLAKGTSPYNQMMTQFTWLAGQMATSGLQYALEFMVMMQGEANMAIGSSASDWTAKLKQLRSDIQADTPNYRPSGRDLVMFTYQTSSHGYYVGTEQNPPEVIAQAQLDVGLTDPLIDMWGPTYMGLPANNIAGQGNVHHGPHGYRLQGLYASKAFRHRLRTRSAEKPNGEKYLPVHATSAKKLNDNTVIVEVFTYHPPLVIDSTYVTELADGMHGVELHDDTGRLAVTSVTITGGNKIRVVTSAIIGSNAFIAFAWTPENRGEITNPGSGPRYASWFFGRETGVRTTIHDSDPETTDLLDESGKPYPLYNYLPIQKIMVQ